ncbi:MAG: DUF362 domain-containing protein [Candidatus Diapherotrites archaeon]|nr:DUF362 domain-containing protein [Candidatus Diapherotrites archaeon]
MKILLTGGKNRVENIRSIVPKLFSDDKIRDKSIFIKPNFTSCNTQLADTSAESLDTVLQILTEHHPSKITVAEGSGESWQQGLTTKSTLKKFGVWDIIQKHGASFVDLNLDSEYFSHPVKTIYGWDKVRINRTFLDYDILISMTVPKSHDYAIMTSSTKNFVMPLIKPEDRVKIHGLRKHTLKGKEYLQSIKLIHYNLASLIKKAYPNYSIIDGYLGMEGNGPLFGTKINCNWALASDNPFMCDFTLAQLIGVNPQKVGYLKFLFNEKSKTYPKDFQEKINQFRKKFKLHAKIETQRKWNQ